VADGGTIFLDEMEKYPSNCRPKLLRVLQEESSSDWEARATPTDARLICRDEPGFGSDGERAEVPIGSLLSA